MRILRNSFVGELGYELHVENKYCTGLYNKMMDIGALHDLKDAGFRALNSLSCEKGEKQFKLIEPVWINEVHENWSWIFLPLGTHQWGFDLRSDDTPIEANLEFACRSDGMYKGKNVIEKQQKEGVFKRLAYFTVNEEIPVWGLEGVYRNGEPAGHLRRAEFGYYINKSIGQSYISRQDGKPIDTEYLKQANYEIDILGKMYPAKLHLKSPFDKTNQRPLGYYSEIPEKLPWVSRL